MSTREPVVIVESSFRKGVGVFDRSPDFECIVSAPGEAEIAELVRSSGARFVIVSTEQYRDELYDALPAGGVIARYGVGHDGIDKALATSRGLLVTNTPGVLEDSVAEHAIVLMGCLARNVAAGHRRMSDRLWQPLIGTDLGGKSLLIVGCGPIGRRTARIAARGFRMRVVGHDVAKLDVAALKVEYGIDELCSDLPSALGEADFVSLHIPAMPETYHFVDRKFLANMKPSGMLINSARGSLVDEAALYDAVTSGGIAGAALDVFESEPYEPVAPDKDLRILDNVVLTPHMGSSTAEACERMACACLANLIAARDSDFGSLNLVNPDVLNT